jgi:hypothetical protein
MAENRRPPPPRNNWSPPNNNSKQSPEWEAAIRKLEKVENGGLTRAGAIHALKATAHLKGDLVENASQWAEKRRYNFISAMIMAAQNGFGEDVEHLLALSRETWGEEILWDAIKDLPHGPQHKRGADGKRMYKMSEGANGRRLAVMDPRGARRTRLMYAAQANDVPRLKWLLARGAKLELEDSAGWTALHWAAQEGRVGTVRELLARGARVDTATNEGDMTPLHVASEFGHLGVVRELLARGAAIGAAMDDGATALYLASQEGRLEVVRELLSAGATVDAA